MAGQRPSLVQIREPWGDGARKRRGFSQGEELQRGQSGSHPIKNSHKASMIGRRKADLM